MCCPRRTFDAPNERHYCWWWIGNQPPRTTPTPDGPICASSMTVLARHKNGCGLRLEELQHAFEPWNTTPREAVQRQVADLLMDYRWTGSLPSTSSCREVGPMVSS
jgi:hypothetical protein